MKDERRARRRSARSSVEVFIRMQIPWIGPLFDRRDDLRARDLRDQLGRGGRIVSWHRDNPRPGSPWTARVSCEDHPETIEAGGRTRRRAILAAAEALARRIKRRRGKAPNSS